MEESVSERIKRLFFEKRITKVGLEKAYKNGLISEEDYHELVESDYEYMSSYKPEDDEVTEEVSEND